MSKKNHFKITRFTNPSGGKVFRVSGSLNGKQVRRNFKARKKAVKERSRLEIERLNGSAHGRQMWVKINHEQHDDAWTALSLLKNYGSAKSLTDAVQYYIENFKEPEKRRPVSDAVIDYIQERAKDLDLGTVSVRQFNSIRYELNKFSEEFNSKPLSKINPSEIEIFLSKGNVSLKTLSNRRAYLQTFFTFCMEKKYVTANPIEKIKRHKVKHTRGTATTLTANQAEGLMKFLETYKGHQFANGEFAGEPGCMVPFFALCLFAGVRPDFRDGEISKIRPQDINLSTNAIHIEPQVSKTNEKRAIKIQPNLKAWLKKYPVKKYPIMPFPNVERTIIQIRKHFKLPHDVLRHTFISMLVGKFRSVGDAALQAGNSEDIVRKHYLDLKSESEASKFWKISPLAS